MTIYIKQNDTSPAVSATLKDGDGAAVDITGASVRFHMRKEGSSDATVDAAAIITDAAAGQVRYTWVADDTAIAGTFIAEFEVTYSNGAVETFPNYGHLQVQIGDDIA